MAKSKSSKRSAGFSTVIFVIIIAVGLIGSKAHLFSHEAYSTSPVVGGVTGASVATSSASAPVAGGASGEYSLVQEPEAGFAPIYSLISSAKSTLDMTMYELEDPTAVKDLLADEKRGVKVRVILDLDFSGGKANASAYSALKAGGVDVKWAPSGTIYHQKTITVDGTVSAIGTANLTAQYYSSSRDAWVIDKDKSQVSAIESTFDNDFGVSSRTGNSVQANGLVWSPGATSALVGQINSAKKSVFFSSEELAYAPVYEALASAAKRGVNCEVVMTNSSSWDKGFEAVTAAGCKVHVFPDSTKALYVHEKQILVDSGTSSASVLVGSQNASSYSLTRNRELSVVLSEAEAPAVLAAMTTTFNTDFNNAPSWVQK